MYDKRKQQTWVTIQTFGTIMSKKLTDSLFSTAVREVLPRDHYWNIAIGIQRKSLLRS